jgi:hypothetical protein
LDATAGKAHRPALRALLLPASHPIERLWKVMHENVTHNKTYAKFRDFADAVLGFLRKTAPRKRQRQSYFFKSRAET